MGSKGVAELKTKGSKQEVRGGHKAQEAPARGRT